MPQPAGIVFGRKLDPVPAGLFNIPALFIGHFTLGFLGVEIAQAVADAASFLLAIPLCLTAINQMMKLSKK